MTDTSPNMQHPPLGVGQILSESFSLLFGNIVAIAVAAFIPLLFMIILSGMTLGFSVSLGAEVADPTAANFLPLILLNTLISVVIYGIVSAIIVQLAYDAKLGRGTNFGAYAAAAISTIVPNVVQTLIITILASFAMLALILPGIWVYGVFAVTVPALVIERVGFGAMRRSSELTKEYRWPVIGTMVVVFIGAMVLNLIPQTIAGFVLGSLSTVSIIAMVLLTAVLSTFTYGLIGIAVALIYARLREIKDGVGMNDLSSVFE